MHYKVWYWFYLTRSYLLHVLPLDLAIARQLSLNFARFTLTGSF